MFILHIISINVTFVKNKGMKRGRNRQLIEERNRKIAEMYNQLNAKGLRSDIIVRTIAGTFYLSEFRVMAIIRELARDGVFAGGGPVIPVKKKKPDMKIQVQLMLDLF